MLIHESHPFTVMRTKPALFPCGFLSLKTRQLVCIGSLLIAPLTFALATTNAVGYVNTTLVPGFTLISNPLFALDNRVGALFGNNNKEWPDGLSVFFMDNGAYQRATFNVPRGNSNPKNSRIANSSRAKESSSIIRPPLICSLPLPAEYCTAQSPTGLRPGFPFSLARLRKPARSTSSPFQKQPATSFISSTR
jgi:hypothetical protein